MTQVTSDNDVYDRVYALTNYADTQEELPQTQLSVLLDVAKNRMENDTQTDKWYVEQPLGDALVAYTCIRAKAAIENFAISGYTMGDEQIQTRNADPDDSQQIQLWADDIQAALNSSSIDSSTSQKVRNTSGYIGETYHYNRNRDDYF
jgi:hypothetical protein